MIIDSLQYNGLCSCGKDHRMQTELCIISKGCLKNTCQYLRDRGISGYTVAVYDKNTYRATEGKRPAVDLEVVLDPTDLHANEYGVDCLSKKLPLCARVLIAVGSGTIHDITRYCAFKMNAEFISCPTAASVDGFCSSVAAMTWHGCKKTLTAVAPRLVIADTDVIMRAPIRLTRSGFGDMIGKYVALFDWKCANIITGEFYCRRIAKMTLDATEAVIDSVDGILSGDADAYEKLMYGLIMSGLAMQMMGNSRPASGAEHHISHFIEMSPPAINSISNALHGEKVGVGTLLVIEEYKRIGNIPSPEFSDYREFDSSEIVRIFGNEMAKEIFAENSRDSAIAVTKEALQSSRDALINEIRALPSPAALLSIYRKFNVKSSLDDIGVRASKKDTLLKYSHLVRNRLTLMRIKKCISD